jgi:hypothetical protein
LARWAVDALAVLLGWLLSRRARGTSGDTVADFARSAVVASGLVALRGLSFVARGTLSSIANLTSRTAVASRVLSVRLGPRSANMTSGGTVADLVGHALVTAGSVWLGVRASIARLTRSRSVAEGTG